jgi:hypothetical protein
MKTRSSAIFAFLFLFVISAAGQTLEFESEVYWAPEDVNVITLAVIKSGEASGAVTVKYSTGDFPPSSSAATAGQDYVATSGTLSFAPGETRKEFTIKILDDAVYEEVQTFFVTLSDPTGGAAVRAPSTAQIHITENDPAPRVRFSSANYSIAENAGAATLTITKTGATEAMTTVYYKTRDKTAKAPSDYTFTGDDLTASVVFEPGETSKQIQISIHDDGFKEPDETFEVYFTVVQNGAEGTPNVATVTITDNDPLGEPPPAKALNISTRASVQTGDRLLIAGFIVSAAPSEMKYVVVRGLGPSLAQNGIPGNQALANPVLQLNKADGSIIAINDNWKDDPANPSQIGGTIYQPKDDREAVIVAALPAGSYTAFVTGKNQTEGIGLVEVYDTNGNAPPELANLSTRGYVGQENDVMIGGFILGNEPGAVEVAIRALGPSLAGSGLSHVLPDPALELHDANGNAVASNDDWESDPAAAARLTAHGLAPSNSKESGLFVTLAPGQYTAIVNGKFAGTGIGLVEIYNLK